MSENRMLEEDKQTSSVVVTQSLISQPVKKSKWQRLRGILWDSLDKSPEERRFLLKLDIVNIYFLLSYMIKYLDQTNIQNAYVSGLKEDLNMAGSQYNLQSTLYYVGYIVGQIPSQYAINKIRPSIWLPTMELLYAVFVMAMAAAKNVKTILVLRFFIGMFEGTAYIGIVTCLSNFYLPDELGKRTCIFQTSSSAAQMFSGYLQSGLYKNMNGKHGLASWRWLFIFDGIITIPVALLGYFCIPDEPQSNRVKIFTPAERQIAIDRMKRANRNTKPNIKFRHFIELFKDWPVYIVCVAFTAHVLGIRLYGYMNLWLKSTGDYSIPQINNLPTIGYGIQIVATLTWAWLSDGFRNRWAIIVIACIPAIIGSIILWVWPEHNRKALMAGWFLLFLETGAGTLFISWISETLSASVEQRYLVIGIVEVVSFAFTAAVPPFLYPADDAPHYKYAYPVTFFFFCLEAACAILIAAIQSLERKGVLRNKHDYVLKLDSEDEDNEIEEEREITMPTA